MPVLRIAGGLLLTLAVLTAALLVGALVLDRNAPAQTEPPAAAVAASPTPTATAGNCEALARVAPQPAPALATKDAGGGMTRVTSAEGDYSLLLPATWSISAGFFSVEAFGQLHAASYDPKAVPTPGPEAPGILPPTYGIRLDIEIWDNADRTPLDRYATTVRIGPDQSSIDPGTFVTIDGRAAYRFAIRDVHRFQREPGQVITTTQTREVWLIATPRDDRIIVAYATPTESDLFPQVEAAVSAMRVTAPFASQVPVIHQRDEISARWLLDAKGAPLAGRRVEAKLVSYREASLAVSGQLGIARMDRDFDELVWVIAVSGPDLPGPLSVPLFHGSGPPPTFPPTTWVLTMAPAVSENGQGTYLASGTAGAWPPRFDALVDRCH